MAQQDVYTKLISTTDRTDFNDNDLKQTQAWLATKPSQESIVSAFISLVSMSRKEMLGDENVYRRFGDSRSLDFMGAEIATLLSTHIDILDPRALPALYALCPPGLKKTNPSREDQLQFIFEQVVEQEPSITVPCIRDYLQNYQFVLTVASELISCGMDNALQAHDNPSFLRHIVDVLVDLLASFLGLGESQEKKYAELASIKYDFDETKSKYGTKQASSGAGQLTEVANHFSEVANRNRWSFLNTPTLSGKLFDKYAEQRDELKEAISSLSNA